MQSRFDDFLEDSQESKAFSVADIAQLEREVNVCKQYYQELLKSAERGKYSTSTVQKSPIQDAYGIDYPFNVTYVNYTAVALSQWCSFQKQRGK